MPSILMNEASFKGDDSEVKVVISRLGTFVNRESELSSAWKVICATVMQFVETNPRIEELFEIYGAASAFASVLKSGGNMPTDLRSWASHVGKFRKGLTLAKVDLGLPDELKEFGREEWFFNASSYWRNWLG